MSERLFLYVLVGYTVIREIFYWITTQRLINKLMSRNYFEYQQANHVGTPPSPQNPYAENGDELEDFAALGGIG